MSGIERGNPEFEHEHYRTLTRVFKRAHRGVFPLWVVGVFGTCFLVGAIVGIYVRGVSTGGRSPGGNSTAMAHVDEIPGGEYTDGENTVGTGEPAEQSISNLPSPATSPVPILMYHEIGPVKEHLPELYVEEEDFRKQIEYLKSQGFVAISMKQACLGWKGETKLPSKPVVVTFDDGYESTYSRALPILRANGFKAVVFLEVNMLSKKGGMSEEQVKEWITSGFEVGSHTLSHPDLTSLDKSRLWREVYESKQMLESKFGVPVDPFCYPGGRFDQSTVDSVKKAGYTSAVTVDYGVADGLDLFRIKRLRVNRSDGLRGFIKKINTALSVPSRS